MAQGSAVGAQSVIPSFRGFGGLGVEGLGPKRVEGYDTVVVVTRRIGLTVMH